MEIIPNKNFLFIEFDYEAQKETETDGGIILIEAEDKFVAIVTYAGENDFGIKAGDKIIVNPNHKFHEFRIGKGYYKMIPIHNVFGIIKD